VSALVASGRVLDFILAAMLAEAIGLTLFHARTGRGVPPADLLPNLASGMSVLLAMRLGLLGVWWPWISLSLLAALGAHVLDLRRKWRKKAVLF
jgi:hypothetical protein